MISNAEFTRESKRRQLAAELRQIAELVSLLEEDPCELYAFELREHAGSVLHMVRAEVA